VDYVWYLFRTKMPLAASCLAYDRPWARSSETVWIYKLNDQMRQ
jgi:hypothetical protein